MIWSIGIPASRLIIGVHSLDQIILGGLLGIWGGFTVHFVFRNWIIRHVTAIIKSERSYLRGNASFRLSSVGGRIFSVVDSHAESVEYNMTNENKLFVDTSNVNATREQEGADE